MPDLRAIRDEYTRKVSGEVYQYEAHFNEGERVEWNAQVYLHGDLKGAPSGTVIDNTLNGDPLKQYVVAYIESIIEHGLGIEE
jgi:hypothetical protein